MRTDVAALCLMLIVGCAATLRAEDKLIPSGRAEEQYLKADVVLYFDGPDAIQIERPVGQREAFKLDVLTARVAKATKERKLAVIIMSKVTRLWPDDKFKAAVDDMEARLKAQGFAKVAIHLASGTFPTPIYRE
jgi:hypothetical protein